MGSSERMLYGKIPSAVLREGAGDNATSSHKLFGEPCFRAIRMRALIKNIGEPEGLPNILFPAIGSLTDPAMPKDAKSRNSAPFLRKSAERMAFFCD